MQSSGLLLVVGVVIASWAGPLIRLSGDAPSLAIAFWRTAIAAAVLLPVALTQSKRGKGEVTIRGSFVLLLPAAFLALHFGTWIASVDLTTVASSVLLVTSAPLFVAFASVVMGKRLGARAWMGIASGVGGGAVIALSASGSQGSQVTGNLLAVAGAVGFAGYLLAGERLRGKHSLVNYVAFVYGFTALILLVISISSGVRLTGFDTETWAAIFAIALGPQLAAHTIFNFLLKDVEAWKLSVAVLAEPVGSAVIAAFLFEEVPGMPVLFGGLVLLTGIALVMSANRDGTAGMSEIDEPSPSVGR